MGWIPDEKPGDDQRSRWKNVPQDLEGMVVSEKELKKVFPADKHYGDVVTLKEVTANVGCGYKVYGQRSKEQGLPRFLAYQCGRCHEIRIGSPEIRDDDSIHEGEFLAGSEGYTVYCKGCNSLLEECVSARS